MKTSKSTVTRFLLSGLLGLWCLFATAASAANAASADNPPQGLSEAQWQNIQQQIQQDRQNSGITSTAKGFPPIVVKPPLQSLIKETKLIADDGAKDDLFGYSLSLDDNRLAVGAVHADGGFLTAKIPLGVVYIFDLINGQWQQSAKLTPSDGIINGWFGTAVSLDGDRVAVGAYKPVVGAFSPSQEGWVYIFELTNGQWQQSAKLTASDGAIGNGFGISLSLDNNRVAIGAYGDGADIDSNAGPGAAYIFDRGAGSSWTQSAKLTANDGAEYDWFGIAVSLNGNRVAVGAEGADIGSNTNQGAVYLFDLATGSWVQSQKLTASDGATKDSFGRSVSLDSNRLAIGSMNADINGYNQGAAYIFDLSGSKWSESAKLVVDDDDVVKNGRFGNSVSLDGDRVAVGANSADIDGKKNQGAVYLFDFGNSQWKQSKKLTARDGEAWDSFGTAISLNGNRLAVGALSTDIGSKANQGAAYVYDGLPPYWLNGLSGTWYDPAYDGSGFNVIQLPNGLLVYYYGYKKDGDGKAQWLLSEVIPGTIVAGEIYTVTMYAGTPGNGGSLTNKPTADGPGVSPWGQAEISFKNCRKGRIRLTGADGKVTHNIVPLAAVSGLTCTTSTANNVSYTAPTNPAGTFSGLTGTWFDPVYDGSGFNMIQTPAGLLLYYYGYKAGADGESLWLLSDVISQPVTVGTTLNVDLHAGFIGNGGSFTQKPTTSGSGLIKWGQAEITFNQCNAGTIRLAGSSASVTHNIIPLATVKGINCAN